MLRARLAPPALALLVLAAVACSSSPDDAAEDSSGGGSVVPAETTTDDQRGAAAEELAVPRPPVVRWAEVLSGPSDEDEIDGVAAGPDGSAWITGKFEGVASFAGVDLESEGGADVPLARIGPDGTPAFVRSFGGSGEDNLYDIDADDRGAVATGSFQGTVAFDDVTLTSEGAADCVVVAFDTEGDVRWARSFGGPGRDGCNEVSLGRDGEVVTSLDTSGGLTLPQGPGDASEAPEISELDQRDTVLLRLDASGEVEWSRRISGDGSERGKAVAVAEDGTIAFGGDATDEIEVGGNLYTPEGEGTVGWISSWEADGRFRWATTWDGPGDDLVKGLAFDGDALYAVGPHTVPAASDGGEEGQSGDLAVRRYDAEGRPQWQGAVGADVALGGAEVVTAADGSLLFAMPGAPGLVFWPGGPDPTVPFVADATEGAGTAWLVRFQPDGALGGTWPVPGTANARTGEIARVEDRIYLDVPVRGDDNSPFGEPISAVRKDGSLWAIDLVPEGP